MGADSRTDRGSGSCAIFCSHKRNSSSSPCGVACACTLAVTQAKATRGHLALSAGSIKTIVIRQKNQPLRMVRVNSVLRFRQGYVYHVPLHSSVGFSLRSVLSVAAIFRDGPSSFGVRRLDAAFLFLYVLSVQGRTSVRPIL